MWEERQRGRKKRSQPKAGRARWLWWGLIWLVVLLLAGWAIVDWQIGPRLWRRMACTVTVNGREAREATVYRSGDGTLLVDLRHAPTHSDVEGGGYLVQPFWNRVRAISGGYYKKYGPFAIVKEIWMPSVEIGLDNEFIRIDPHLEAVPDHVSFVGLGQDVVVVHGDVLLPWPER